jgi:hypothetical protein
MSPRSSSSSSRSTPSSSTSTTTPSASASPPPKTKYCVLKSTKNLDKGQVIVPTDDVMRECLNAAAAEHYKKEYPDMVNAGTKEKDGDLVYVVTIPHEDGGRHKTLKFKRPVKEVEEIANKLLKERWEEVEF